MRSGARDEKVLSPSEQLVVDATIGVFMHDSVKYAARYCTEAGRSTLHPKDLELGMKYTACPSYGFLQREDVQGRIRERTLYPENEERTYETSEEEESAIETEEESAIEIGDEEQSAEETGDEEESTEGGVGAEETEEWTYVVTEDTENIAYKMNSAESEYDAWHPQHDTGLLIKHVVEQTMHESEYQLGFMRN